MKRVENKIAIVFGGGQTAGEAMGNGRATCVTLAREGAHVVVVDRDLTSAQETVALIHAANGQAECAQADQTNDAQVNDLIAAVIKRHARIDILHNNIGASLALGDAVAGDITEAALDRSFSVNFKSACYPARPRYRICGNRDRGLSSTYRRSPLSKPTPCLAIKRPRQHSLP